jgi:hypothetical protein
MLNPNFCLAKSCSRPPPLVPTQVKKVHFCAMEWQTEDEGACFAILADVVGYNERFKAWSNASITPPIWCKIGDTDVTFLKKDQPLTLLFNPKSLDGLPGSSIAEAEWAFAVKTQDEQPEGSLDITMDFDLGVLQDVYCVLQLYMPNVPEKEVSVVLEECKITCEVVPRTNKLGKNTGLYWLFVKSYQVRCSLPQCRRVAVLPALPPEERQVPQFRRPHLTPGLAWPDQVLKQGSRNSV